MITKIDANNPENLSDKPSNEKETRQKFLAVARDAGREKDMFMIFVKYDKLLRSCDNDDKKKDIGKIGAIEAYKLLLECFASLKSNGTLEIDGLNSNCKDFWVDGELVYKGK